MSNDYSQGHVEVAVGHTHFDHEDLDKLVDESMKEMTEKFWFKLYLVLLSVLSIGEAILVGFGGHGLYFKAQVIILAISTLIFFVGNFLITCHIVSKDLSFFQALNALLTPGETKFEIACFILGWTCIFEKRGIAALRIFRVVRVLWYLELDNDDESSEPGWFVIFRKGGELVIKYLERIGNELFSTSTRGGPVVLMIYFYTIYVFAVVYWNEIGAYNSSNTSWYNSNTNQNACDTLSHCYITLMRLSLYDGNGFDLMSNMVNSPWKGLAVLLVIYMCFSAVTLLNGLIGIFASSFTNDDNDDKDDQEQETDKDKNTHNKEKMNEQVETHDLTIKDVWNRLDRIENLLLSLTDQ